VIFIDASAIVAILTDENEAATLIDAIEADAERDAETSRYLQAYEGGQVTGRTVPEPSAEQFARVEEQFGSLATKSLAVLAGEEDLAGLRASLPPWERHALPNAGCTLRRSRCRRRSVIWYQVRPSRSCMRRSVRGRMRSSWRSAQKAAPFHS
jgi:predicted nucleic acid-binding protein